MTKISTTDNSSGYIEVTEKLKEKNPLYSVREEHEAHINKKDDTTKPSETHNKVSNNSEQIPDGKRGHT